MAIGVFIRGRDMGSVVAEMQEKAKALETAAGLLRDMGRRIRKPAARHEAAGDDRPVERVPDFLAAVRRVRIGQTAPC